ncbi:MAG TPA: DNRLRE domain-containing protein [Frankiaceae bacterium]|nr:DNRLRE domain-containing protein [Frankiaceae bacterium]
MRVRRVLGAVTSAAVLSTGLAVAVPQVARAEQAEPVDESHDSVRPDVPAAQVLARMTGKRVEVSGERSETDTLWANPDGTLTRRTHTAPIRVRDAAGEWQDVDATLIRDGATVRPRAVPFEVRFSAGGSGELASLSDGKHRYALSWPDALPAPALDGPTATYANVAPDTDLVVTATRGGFEQFLVLKARPTRPVAFRLPVSLTGLTFGRGPAGEIRLRNRGGDLVMRGPAPTMHDATMDAAGRPTREKALGVKVTTSGRREMVVAPDPAWLADPGTRYPVVLDPATTLARASDTYVESGGSAATNFNGATDLKFGARNTGSGVVGMRTFITFPTTGLAGKHILTANVKVWNWQSNSCTTNATYIEPVTSAWNPATVTWNNQPTAPGPSVASTSSIYGNTGCLTANWLEYSGTGVRDLVQGWVDGTTANYGVRFHASETNTISMRRLTSGDATSGNPPALEVTYNSYPPSPMGRYVTPSQMGAPDNTRYASSTTPTLGAMSCDPDGSSTRIDFEVWNSTKNVLIASNSTTDPPVPSCTASRWTVSPALTNGTTYYWRTRAHDGTDYSKSWSSWVPLVIDTTAPPAPSVASTTFTQGSWVTATAPATTSYPFTFAASPSTDVAGYYYSIDDPNVSTFTTSTSASAPVSEGWHTLRVQTADLAGNRSAVTTFTFGHGHLSVTSPTDGARTSQHLTLAVSANPGVGTLTWQRINAAGSTVALTQLKDTNGNTVTQPITITGGVVPTLTWDVETELGSEPDGPIRLTADVRTTSAPTVPVATRTILVTYDRNDFAMVNATSSAGPGVVNLVTGNFQTSATDATLSAPGSDLQVGRTFNSRDDNAGANGPFGPGWVMSAPVESAGSNYTGLAIDGTTATLSLVSGDTLGFVRPTTTATAFTSEYGAEDLELVDATSASPQRYDLTDLEGNVTSFTKPGTSTKWVPTAVVRTGAGSNATKYAYETVTVGSESVTRVTRVIAPQVAGLGGTCETSPETVTGCRSLKLTYAASTTTPPSSGLFGDYPHRVQKVEVVAYNGDKTPTAGMDFIAVAQYEYDSNGRLARAWDPRISPALKTEYTYNGDGQIASIKPPAERAFTFAYAPLSTEASGTGRLKSVTRDTLLVSPTTATTTFVYRVPVSGTGAPYDLSSGELDRTGQQDRPTTATAVFPPTTAATFGGGSLPVPSSYDRASVHYLNPAGREVNTADANGGVTTTEHDGRGNVVRTLSAANRKAALDSNPSDTAAAEAAMAQTLSSVTVYSTDGLEEKETFGPEHQITLTDGTLVRAREHVVNTYDEGMTGGPFHLVTTSVTSARVAGESADRTMESRTTKTEYGTSSAQWELGQPTASIVDAVTGGLNITTRTTYSADGRVLTQTLPAGGTTTNTAATRVTRYYIAGTGSGDTACDSKAEWADLVCSVGPGGQPSGVALPTVYTTYDDVFHKPLVVTEKVSGSTLRTTTTEYDTAGRPWKTSVTASTGTTLPTVETYYDSNGRATETRNLDGTGAVTDEVTRVFNELGQLTSYTDTDGTTSTTTYDVAGRPVATYDGKGTQTRTYDGGSERRGLVTSLVDTHAGTWTATYDTAGTATVDWPNGLRSTTTVDETGLATSLTYAATSGCSGAACTVFSETVHESIHGQWLARASTLSDQAYTYDAAGRLTVAADSVAGACETRRYTFDAGGAGNGNRTKLETFAPGTEGACQTTTASSTVNSTYDAADRITTTGTVYDALGRTTTVPDADALDSGALTVGYHVNDLVRSIGIAGGATQTYTLDVDQQRVRSWTDGTTTRTNHYDGDGDNPAWTQEGVSPWTRNVGGITGDLAAIYSSATSAAVLQLTNLHGDVVATATTSSTALASTAESTEYGTPRGATGTRYAWLGGKQRAADTPSGLSIMGVRLYNPAIGKFLQVDPVYGGNANAYVYPHDPLTQYDLDGRRCLFGRAWGKRTKGRCRNPLNAAGRAHARGRRMADEGAAIGAGIGTLVGSRACVPPTTLFACGGGLVMKAGGGATIGYGVGYVGGATISLLKDGRNIVASSAGNTGRFIGRLLTPRRFRFF